MAKFEDLKVGDRVKVVAVGGFEKRSLGKFGVIHALDHGANLNVLVYSENGHADWGNSSELELVSESEQQSLISNTIRSKLAQIETLVSEIRSLI